MKTKTPVNILFTIWLTALSTFTLTSAYILLNEKNINAPGELGEAFSAIAIILIAMLVGISAAIFAWLKR